MSDDMLHDILEVERQIEADLAAERTRIADWLVRQKAEVDRQAETDMARAAATACRNGETRCQEARDQAAAQIREMRHRVRRLQQIPDDRLRRVVERYLPEVTGEAEDDYPDGEN